MKILLIASTPWSIISFRGKLITSLINSKFEVHICAPFGNEYEHISSKLENEYYVKTHDINLKRASFNIKSDLVYIYELVSLIKLIRPDSILSYTMKPVIFGSIVGWLLKTSSVNSMITGLGFLFSDSNSNRQKLVKFFGKHILKFGLRRNHNVIFQNHDDKDLFIDEGIINSSQNILVTNGSGVDLNYYSVKSLPSKPSFLLIARMIKNKGIYDYIEAIKIIKKSYPFISFDLLGGVEKNIDAIPIENINAWVNQNLITYYGEVADVRKAIERCSIYVLPSYREGTPRSVLEAMSMGRPIITTDVPGCKNTVINGFNGYLVEPKNPLSLANAMEKLINNRILRDKTGHSSRLLAEEKFNDIEVAEKIVSQLIT